MDWINLSNKVIIITGGSTGIGAAIVDLLLQLDAKVANWDIVPSEKSHANLLNINCNVTSLDDVKNAIHETLKVYNNIYGLVNNAGINIPRILVDSKDPNSKYEISEEIFNRMIDVNLKGALYVAQEVGRIFIKNNNGVIVNMGSESGLEGSEGQSIYAATKAAMYSLTRSWAKELGKHNVRVIGIAPGILEATGLRTLEYEEALAYTRNININVLREGYSKTTTTPLGRSGKLSEVADLVAFSLSERANYLTGITINISGGKSRG